jgi:hypothetical protein
MSITKNQSKLLLKVFRAVLKSNEATPHDVFFSVSPHTQTFDVYYHLNGWKTGKHSTIISNCTSISKETIDFVISELEKLK